MNPTPRRLAALGLLLLGIAPAAAVAADRHPFAAEGTPKQTERPRTIDVQHIRADLRLDTDASEVRGTITHTFAPLHAGLKSVDLDCGKALEVTEVRLGDQECKFDHDGDALKVELPRAIGPDDAAVLSIDYHGKPKRGLYFIKPDPACPPRELTVWSQGEPDETHEWLPCYASPNDKATSEMVVTVAKPLKVVSNGALIETREAGDDTVTYHWKLDVPHASYLISLAAADFNVYEDRAGDLPLTYYTARAIDEATARRALGNTPKMVAFFNERLGITYPYPKYAQVAVPEFTWGGMENISATTLNDQTFRDEVGALEGDSDSLVAHELAHQWFGDLVTCRDWSQLWLNEGFASYFDPLYREHAEGQDAFALAMLDNLRGYRSSDEQYRRPIVEPRYDDVRKLFDGVTYQKGACVLHALRGLVGDEAWWAGIRGYLQANQKQVVGTDDFRKAMEQASGRDLGWFFDQWVFKPGHPELALSWRYEPEDRTVRVKVRQTQKTDDGTPIFRLPTTLELLDDGGKARAVPVVVDAASQEFVIPAEAAPRSVWIDPAGWLPASIEADKSTAEWVFQLDRAPTLVARLYAAHALAGKKDDKDAVAALGRAWSREREPGARRRILGYLNNEPRAHRDALLVAADDADATVRREAFDGLERLDKSDDLVRHFRKAWADPKEAYGVRAVALRGLVKWGADDADDLIDAAADAPSYRDTLAQAALGLARHRSSGRAKAVLIRLAEPGRSIDLRRGAIGAIAGPAKDDATMQDALIARADDPDARVRKEVWKALADLKLKRALPALEARRESEDEGRGPLDEAIAALKRDKRKPPADSSAEIADLEKKAAELELRARELNHEAEALRIKAERRKLGGGDGK